MEQSHSIGLLCFPPLRSGQFISSNMFNEGTAQWKTKKQWAESDETVIVAAKEWKHDCTVWSEGNNVLNKLLPKTNVLFNQTQPNFWQLCNVKKKPLAAGNLRSSKINVSVSLTWTYWYSLQALSRSQAQSGFPQGQTRPPPGYPGASWLRVFVLWNSCLSMISALPASVGCQLCPQLPVSMETRELSARFRLSS